MSTPSSSALTMITLCDISYKPKEAINVSVQNYNRTLEVVWGPVEHIPKGARESASLLYIVKGNIVSQSNAEYTVVIRGTNFKSWDSWIGEDFSIGTTVRFNTFVKSAPSAAVIAQGTAAGMGYLINKSNDSSGLSPHAFLKKLGSGVKYLNVTGHSLGGTLTPPYFAFIRDALSSQTQCLPFSFAGLTPGNEVFSSWFQSLLPAGLLWRYVNPLDIAPNCWWSLENIKNIYAPNGLACGLAEKLVLDALFLKAPRPPENYVQPDGMVTLPARFNTRYSRHWPSQAFYQHHSSTYISLFSPPAAAEVKKTAQVRKPVKKPSASKKAAGQVKLPPSKKAALKRAVKRKATK